MNANSIIAAIAAVLLLFLGYGCDDPERTNTSRPQGFGHTTPPLIKTLKTSEILNVFKSPELLKSLFEKDQFKLGELQKDDVKIDDDGNDNPAPEILMIIQGVAIQFAKMAQQVFDREEDENNLANRTADELPRYVHRFLEVWWSITGLIGDKNQLLGGKPEPLQYSTIVTYFDPLLWVTTPTSFDTDLSSADQINQAMTFLNAVKDFYSALVSNQASVPRLDIRNTWIAVLNDRSKGGLHVGPESWPQPFTCDDPDTPLKMCYDEWPDPDFSESVGLQNSRSSLDGKKQQLLIFHWKLVAELASNEVLRSAFRVMPNKGS